MISKVGIDKLELNNIIVKNLDYDKLKNMSNVHFQYSDTPTSLRCNYVNYKQIVIRNDDNFQSLAIMVQPGCNSIIVSLNLSVSLLTGESNVEPFSWIEYNDSLHKLQNHILREYGIGLDMDTAMVRYIELTGNIEVSAPYREYEPCLAVLMSFLPGNLKYHEVRGAKAKAGATIYRKNNSREVVVYDKNAQQNQRKKSETKQLIRLEIRLNSRSYHRIIEKELGTRIWSELNDATITDYFYHYFSKYFVDRYDDWCQRRSKELKKDLKALRKKYPRRWHNEIMTSVRRRTIENKVPYILDLSQIEDALRELLQEQGRKNISRTLKTLRQSVDNGDPCRLHDCELFLQGNLQKMDEILSSISASQNESSQNDSICPTA